MIEKINAETVEGGKIYFVTESGKVCFVTGAAIAYVINKQLGYKLRPTIYFSEAEAKVAALKGVQNE
jgi:hypothetical protein